MPNCNSQVAWVVHNLLVHENKMKYIYICMLAALLLLSLLRWIKVIMFLSYVNCLYMCVSRYMQNYGVTKTCVMRYTSNIRLYVLCGLYRETAHPAQYNLIISAGCADRGGRWGRTPGSPESAAAPPSWPLSPPSPRRRRADAAPLPPRPPPPLSATPVHHRRRRRCRPAP